MKNTLKNALVVLLAMQLVAANCLGAAFFRETPPDKTIRILAIGNSFTVNACKYLPEITASVEGYEISITRATIGGASLEKHANLIEECKNDLTLKPYDKKHTLKELLQKDDYDFVTIQQVSSLSFDADSYQPSADILVHFINEQAPSAQILIHQTWAYSPDCKRLEELDISRAAMHNGLVESYQYLAENYGFEILPSGNVFYSSYAKNPEIHLWISDGYHANEFGEYLAGLVWFGKLSGKSPNKVKYVPEGIDPKSAKFLRGIADKQIKKLK